MIALIRSQDGRVQCATLLLLRCILVYTRALLTLGQLVKKELRQGLLQKKKKRDQSSKTSASPS